MPQDFSGQNLRGRSFKGRKDLVEANFSYADIRGANFTDTNLTGANFSHAQAGLQRRWTIFLVLVSLLSALSENISPLPGVWISYYFDSSYISRYGIISGVLVFMVLAVFFIVSQGLGVEAGVVLGIYIAWLGIYIAWRALAGDEKHALIRTIEVTFPATGGTSFCQANLTNANFTGATLKSTDFRGAILTHTCWHEAKKLDLARVGNSILAKAAVRDLLITGNGYKKSYTGENLQGANLTGANLNEANLKEADISQAKLQGANLERANLTKAQAVGTDFTNAYLTGACLEAWNINSTTKLEQVDCQYVFLLEYPDAKGSRERRPHDPDQVFEAGDFGKLYKKIMNIVQILLRNGVNPEAFKVAFEILMEENPGITGNSIQAIEKKDNDVLVTIQVPEGTDKGKIERDFSEPYKLEVQKQAALLEAEIRHNQDLKEIATLALTKNLAFHPIINLTNDLKSESKAMTDSIDQSRKIDNKDGNVIGNILGDSGTISGNVAHTINQLPDNPNPIGPESRNY